MKNKIFKLVGLFLFVFAFVSTAGSVSAAASLVSQNVGAYSLTLKLSDATPNTNYTFSLLRNEQLKDSSGNPIEYNESKIAKTDNTGSVSVSFDKLTSNSNYVGSYRLNSTSPILEVLYIKTLSSIDVNTLDDSSDVARITSISPTEGKVGDTVTIKGYYLDNISEILFGSIKVIAKTSNSSTVTISVPEGAVTSKITIKTADNGNAISPTDFKIPSISASTPITTNTSNTNQTSKGIVPKCNTGDIDPATGQYKNPCDFKYFMDLVNNVIKFVLFTIATPFVAIIIMYTGYLFITAGGNSGQNERAKHILTSVVIGYIIALGAWLLVNTIMKTFKVDPSINTFLEE